MNNAHRLSLALCACVCLSTVAHATDPSKRVAEWRKQLQVERAALLAKLDKQEQVVNYVRRWLISEPQDRIREVRPNARTSTKYLARIHKRKEVVLDRILEFPWESRGSVVSGRALNALLDACGETAAQRREKSEFLQQQAGLGGGPELPERITIEVDEQNRSLSLLQVPENLVRRIRFSRGLTESKLTGRINEDVLSLEWPLVLRDPVYTSYRDVIQEIRQKALKELANGKGIEFATAVDLKQSVDKLYLRILSDEGRLARRKVDANYWLKYRRAVSHVDRMRHSVLRFAEAIQIEDVHVPEFKGKTVEELCAYMHVNAMRFVEAGPNDQEAYYQIFRLMTRYYVEMQFQRSVLERDEKQLERLASMDNLQEMADRVLFLGQYVDPLTNGTGENEFRRKLSEMLSKVNLEE